jgi:hypothetical protein
VDVPADHFTLIEDHAVAAAHAVRAWLRGTTEAGEPSEHEEQS